MRHRFRLTLAAGVILASAAASVMLVANTGWAGSFPARAGDPKPSSTGNPTPNDPGPTPSDPGPPPGTAAPTGGAPPPEEELPCNGGAAWDGLNQAWRAFVDCGEWVFIMDGRFGDRDTAWKVGNDEAYIQSQSQGGRVKDGPGCLPPFVLC